MTAMKYGVYALVAVVFGVVLVGLLPGQLSNMTSAPTGLLKGGAEDTNVTTPTGQDVTTLNGTIITSLPSRTGNATLDSKSAATAASEAQSKADAATAAASGVKTYSFEASYPSSDPYADLMYYGMLGVGLIVAISAYLVARRVSG